MVSKLMLGTIRIYQRYFSGLLPASCRYHPSCSEYAGEAVRTHGPVRGGWLGAKRLARCHPWGGYGIDLVPGAPECGEACSGGAHGGGTTGGGEG